MKPAKLVLHIDRLRLHGVPPAERDALVASLRAGLEQAFAQDGVAGQWAERGHRERVRVQVAASTDPVVFGRAVARSIVNCGAT